MGQTVIVIAAMALLSTIAVSVNNTLISNDDALRTTQFEMAATMLGQNIIEEAVDKAFDEATVGATGNVPLSRFKGAEKDSLGLEGAERYPFGNCPRWGCNADSLFDDVDDFDGYTEKVGIGPDFRLVRRSTSADSAFEVAVQVGYIQDNDIDYWGTRTSTYWGVSTKTFYKKMVVIVYSPYLQGRVSSSVEAFIPNPNEKRGYVTLSYVFSYR